MPNIIYQKTPGQLIAQGDRTVSTFPSGLIRVDQSFICPTTDAASQRALLPVESNFPGGNEPSLDGIFVYPEIQEKRQPDGFTEFIVSGYGRTSDTLQNQQKTINTRLTSASSTTQFVSQNVFASSNQVSGFIVIEKNSGLDVGDLGFAPDYFDRYNITSQISDIQTRIFSFNTRPLGSYIDWNGDLKNSSLKTIGLQFSNTQGQFVDDTVYFTSYLNPRITVINRNNFGRFIELEIEVQ
jgi:hypothetical protein